MDLLGTPLHSNLLSVKYPGVWLRDELLPIRLIVCEELVGHLLFQISPITNFVSNDLSLQLDDSEPLA